MESSADDAKRQQQQQQQQQQNGNNNHAVIGGTPDYSNAYENNQLPAQYIEKGSVAATNIVRVRSAKSSQQASSADFDGQSEAPLQQRQQQQQQELNQREEDARSQASGQTNTIGVISQSGAVSPLIRPASEASGARRPNQRANNNTNGDRSPGIGNEDDDEISDTNTVTNSEVFNSGLHLKKRVPDEKEAAKQQVLQDYAQGPKKRQVNVHTGYSKNKYLGIDARIFELQTKNFTTNDIVMECTGLSKVFSLVGREDQIHALSDINLSQKGEFFPIRRGEFVMVRGPSGGGKTTFLNMLGTIDMPSGGTIKILGSVIDEKSDDEYLSKLRLEKIGFVFQTFNLLATMTAYENVELPMRILGKLSEKEMKTRVRNLLMRVGLQDRMDHLPSELSGGEQQRVAIARALANSPQVLLLDEPTGDLDTRATVEVMNLLLSINNFGYSLQDQQKVTMVMVTHNPDIECYADRILYFRDGRIIKQILNEVQTPLEWEDYVDYLNYQNNN